MRKSMIAICLITFFAQGYFLFGQTPKTNFREATWGMTQKAVIKLEGQEPRGKGTDNITGLDYIGYTGKAGSLSCNYFYYFADDKLVKGWYIFTDDHFGHKEAYIDDFNTAKNALAEKYGKPAREQPALKSDKDNVNDFLRRPTKEKSASKNDIYKMYPELLWDEMAQGKVRYEAFWTLDDTEIFLYLTVSDYKQMPPEGKTHHMLHYKSTRPEHIDLMNKAEEKAKKGIW